MNQKKAFKHLSHQFHNKNNEKQKTKKHFKKIDDDKKRKTQNFLNANQATSMNNAMRTTTKKNKQIEIRFA